MTIKAILFDIDDTLYDRSAAQTAVLDIIIQRFPALFRDVPLERARWAFAESDRIITADFYAGAPSAGIRDARTGLFLRLLGLPETTASEIGDVYVREYPALNTPVAGAVDTVKVLSNKYRIGAVSNGLPDVQYRKLETIGIRSLLSCVVLSEELGIRKPEPGIFSHAAQAVNTPPGACLFVGDSFSADVIGAKRVGMQACWYNPGGGQEGSHSIKADFMIARLSELTGILK